MRPDRSEQHVPEPGQLKPAARRGTSGRPWCHRQVVRQRSAKPSFPGSNPLHLPSGAMILGQRIRSRHCRNSSSSCSDKLREQPPGRSTRRHNHRVAPRSAEAIQSFWHSGLSQIGPFRSRCTLNGLQARLSSSVRGTNRARSTSLSSHAHCLHSASATTRGAVSSRQDLLSPTSICVESIPCAADFGGGKYRNSSATLTFLYAAGAATTLLHLSPTRTAAPRSAAANHHSTSPVSSLRSQKDHRQTTLCPPQHTSNRR